MKFGNFQTQTKKSCSNNNTNIYGHLFIDIVHKTRVFFSHFEVQKTKVFSLSYSKVIRKNPQ